MESIAVGWFPGILTELMMYVLNKQRQTPADACVGLETISFCHLLMWYFSPWNVCAVLHNHCCSIKNHAQAARFCHPIYVYYVIVSQMLLIVVIDLHCSCQGTQYNNNFLPN